MRYGLIGEKLGHSFSAEIHRQLGGYDYELKELAPEELEGFIRACGFEGINVTIPYKQAVMPLLDEISDAAREIGAVNTIVSRGGKLHGYNTDCTGLEMLIDRTGIEAAGKKVLIAGSGGTSRTAAYVAKKLGASEVIRVSRSGRDGAVTYEEAYEKHGDAEIIINTTPAGMYPDVDGIAIDPARFEGLEGVIDAVYNPLTTELVSRARSQGVKAANGLYMLVAQAAAASALFTGAGEEPLTGEPSHAAGTSPERPDGSQAEADDSPERPDGSQAEADDSPERPDGSQAEAGASPERPDGSQAEAAASPGIEAVERVYKNILLEKSNIVLTGMPGSGKSTVAAQLAKKLGRELISTDDEIVSSEGMEITEIFRRHGEQYFRDAETEVIRKASLTGGRLISTGGGAVLREENVKLLRMNGIIIFLDRDPSELRPSKSRPLADDADKMRSLYKERYPIYKENADVTVPVRGTPEETADDVWRALDWT